MNPAADHPAIIARCAALGLSLDQVKRLAGMDHSRFDLAYMLALNPFTLAPVKPKRWLWMAAQTCSVSYRVVLTPEGLLEVLTTGTVPPADEATFLHFLEEAPLSIVVMAVEQAAQESGVAIAQIWRNVDQIAATWSSTRLRAIAAGG
jgi:hypothetical protein